jgi:sensor domain CHASE-containing protein
MLLEKRIKLVLMGLLALCVGWVAFIQYAVVYRTYTRLEQDQAMEDVERCINAIRRESYHLEVLADDWGSWDDMYRFVQDRNPEFDKATFTLEAIASIDLNLVCLIDPSNSIIRCITLDSRTKSPMAIQAFSQPALPPGHPLLTHQERGKAVRILRTEHGVMLVASCPILPTNEQGPARGTLIMGRYFNDANVEMLVQQTLIRFTAWNLSANSLPSNIREVAARTSPDKPLIELEPATDTLKGFVVLQDTFGEPALLVDATIPRAITDLGQESTLQACVWLLMVIVIVWASLFGFLNRSVVWPILRLRRQIATLNPDIDPSRRLPVQRDDEIGELARSFNATLDRLTQEDTRTRQAEPAAPHV